MLLHFNLNLNANDREFSGRQGIRSIGLIDIKFIKSKER